MSESQVPLQRTSKRATQGIPPVRFESYVHEMATPRSPLNKSCTPASSMLPSSQEHDAQKSRVTSPQKSSQSSVTTASKELLAYRSEFKNQMEEMKKQMLLMQTQFLNNTKEMQKQLVSNNEEISRSMQQLRTEMQETIVSTQQMSIPQLHPNIMTPSTSTQTAPSPPLQLFIPPNQPSQVVPPNNNAVNTPVYNLPQKKIYPLPVFSGLPEEWQTFAEAFESTTSEFMYSDLHNIMRLREALKERAHDAVECLLSNSANVKTIMKTLQETFGRPEQLIRSQIEKVRRISPITDDNLEALVSFANKVNNMATFLKNVRGEHHLSNPSLLSELVVKLPINRQMQWGEKCLLLERAPTIVDFSNWLETLRRIANIIHDTLPPVSTTSNRRQLSAQPSHRKFSCVAVSDCPVCHGVCSSVSNCKQYLEMPIDKKWSKIKEIKVCFGCLTKGHQLKQCRKKRICGTNHCQRFHHVSLHKAAPYTAENNIAHPTNSPTQQTENRNCHAVISTDAVLFQILPVKLYGKNKTISTYAFVDDGANVSMIDTQVAHELELRGQRETLSLQWLNKQSMSQDTERVELTISGVGATDKRYTISNVFTTSELSLPIQSCHLNSRINISQFKFQDYSNVQPKLILSLTHCFLTVPLEAPSLLSASGPILITTRLGTVVYGPAPGESTKVKRVLHARTAMPQEASQCSLLKEMHNMMRDYFEVETLGVKPNTKQLISADDERALNILKETTKRVGNRFECRLLWKENVPPIPDSYNMALNRLRNVEKKMARDSEYENEYRNKINEYILKGYARKLGADEILNNKERVFYLPHFGVKNLNKKGIRIVFDAAAEVQGISLNKSLLSGPDLNNSLISILLKFRESPVAVCGDIKEMFHQIQIAGEDQNSQRFLWRTCNASKAETYIMQRMIFGATCSPTVAQFVKNLNASSYLKELPRAVYGITDRHYVDDYVDCFESEEEAIKVVNDVIRIHKGGGFELRNLISNSDRVIQSCIQSAARTGDTGEFLNKENIERILGIHWLPKPDVFCFILKLQKIEKSIVNFSKIPTKREMLSVNMSIYDPFGFLCDFMVTSKILMQQVWKTGIDWDDEIPIEIYKHWKVWLVELSKIELFRVPRSYSKDFASCDVELHVFVDASEEAMAAVAYWRVVRANSIDVVFITGKTSCAPMRFHTIPKLELQAAVMGLRLKELVVNNHVKGVNKMFFWTDSHTVIQWIRSDHRKYKQYVANRVSEILEGSTIEDWRWCPGVENPADAATRAKVTAQYRVDGRWTSGPAFLQVDESQWPSESQMSCCLDNSRTELRCKHSVLLARQICSIIPQINRFSKYHRLKRATAWIWRYIQNLLRKTRGMQVTNGELTVEEESWAEIYLCRHVQQQIFADELASLHQKGFVDSTSSIKTLNPIVGNDGLIRAFGRLKNAECLATETKTPIILPTNHRFTYLLVESYHVRLYHMNLATVMSEIRLRFWIPSLRRMINSIQSRCQVCRIQRAKPCQPQMAPLPKERVTPYVRPFTYTGIDYFGPLSITVGRRREKRWVAIFTCLSIRAIHLEIATDLSTDSCLLCIRNFVNRRGVPLVIRSDNGTNFVGIAKELRGVSSFFDNNLMTSSLTSLGIKWIFNTPANPAEGGVWERLVQSVKKVLQILLKEHSPQLQTLQSFLIEAENMINARPLTHLAVTPEDAEPLTPNHFLLGYANSTQTPAAYEPRLMCLRKQWRIVQNLKNGMWHRWIREYLPELTRRTKWCLPTQPITIGCLVFICDPDMPRSQWTRGRVVELFPGKDGVARTAKISTSSGIYRRPVSKLAILDVSDEAACGETSPSGSVHGGGNVDDGNQKNG